MKVLKFDPRNGFHDDITGASGCVCGHNHYFDLKANKWVDCPQCLCENPRPKKAQTIRDKPCVVGERYALWEMWRGMKKGLYCTHCWHYTDAYEGYCPCHIEGKLPCDCVQFPRKLLEVEMKECVEIEMTCGVFRTAPDSGDIILKVAIPKKQIKHDISYDDNQHSFIKADTPSWTNKQFIDFFLKTYPKIKKEWVKFWIWRW